MSSPSPQPEQYLRPLVSESSTTRQLLESRIVFLGTEITDDVASELCTQLLLLDSVDSKRDIRLFIDSRGGSIGAGMAIHDTMNLIRPDVATIALGFAASLGQFLLSSGARGKRFAVPHARIVLQQPHGGFGGSPADVTLEAEQLAATKTEITRLTAVQTGRSVDEIDEDAARQRWFTADSAVAYGLVDHAISGPLDW